MKKINIENNIIDQMGTKQATFEVYFYQILNEKGLLNKQTNDLDFLTTFVKDEKELIKIYACMKKTRLFDAKAINLQKTGNLGTYPSSLWHEAIGVAIGSSMQNNDLFCPYYRDLGTMLWRGVLMEEILSYWGGELNGNNFKNPIHDFPFCVPIASQTLHAVGAAFAVKHKQTNQVVVTTIGDGGTSKGDFYEALNLASIWNLPVVFVIINNQFAISTPRDLQTKSPTLAQKAIAVGMDCEQVDGNDVLALKNRLDLAIKEARSKYKPKLIEAITYRMNDHTTADDATRYRTKEEKEQHLKTDPLLRFKLFLEKYYKFDTSDELTITKNCQQEIEQAIQNYLLLPRSKNKEEIFEHVYKIFPENLTRY